MNQFLPSDEAWDLLKYFPRLDENWYKYDNLFEKKRALDQVDKMPYPFGNILLRLNSGPFVNWLSDLTGIDDLTADPYMRGGGCHLIEKGGFLDVHSDFGLHPRLKLYRRLNVLIYLNDEYQDSFGGKLQLWSRDMKTLEKEISPRFNRMVVFETSAKSYHGHPVPWQGPQPRKSIALYFYSSTRPSYEINEESTKFQKLPNEPYNEEKEILRERRNRGRLASNI